MCAGRGPKVSSGRVAVAGHQSNVRPDDGDAAPPLHAPYACRRCGGAIFWAIVLDERGERLRRFDGRGWRAIAVDAAPDSAGTVLLFHRPDEGIVCRILNRCEAPPPAARLRRRHPYPCTTDAWRPTP